MFPKPEIILDLIMYTDCFKRTIHYWKEIEMVGNGGLDNSSVLHNIKGLVGSQVSFSPTSAQAFDKGILRSHLISGLVEP